MRSDSDEESLTDKEKLQDAEDTIHELQHDLEKLQIELAEAKKEPTSGDVQVVASLRQELKTCKEEHAAEVEDLKKQLANIQKEHEATIEKLRQEHNEELAKQKADLLASK